MRRLIRLLIVLALLWSAWWFAASFAIREGIARSPDMQVGTVEVTGYPLAFATEMRDVRLTDQASGAVLRSAALNLRMPAWWPGDATLRLPQERVDIVYAGQDFTLNAANAVFAAKIVPAAALALETVGMDSDAWTLSLAEVEILSGPALRATLTRTAVDGGLYSFDIGAGRLRVGADLRAVLGVPSDWPATLSALDTQGSIRFAEPLNRHHLGGRVPQIEAMTIGQVQIIWGSAEISAAGHVTFDARGVPEGDVSVLVKDWRRIYQMARAQVPPQAEIMLNALANIGGDPDTLDLVLRFEGGNAFLGPIPLGPVPPLVAR